MKSLTRVGAAALALMLAAPPPMEAASPRGMVPDHCVRATSPRAERDRVGAGLVRSRAFSQAVVAELNYYRCRAGVAPGAADAGATRTSASHSAWMASAGRMSHDSTVPGRRSFADRLEAEGIRVRVRAYENIAHLRHFSVNGLSCRAGRRVPTEGELAREVVRMWYGSPQHRRQMMAPEVTRAGGGAAASESAGTCGTLFLTLNLYR